MKKNNLLFLLLILISLTIYLRVGCVDKKARENHFQKQLGTFVLDIQKTDLGQYRENVSTYKNLTLTFNEDYTFYFNMKVPFIYDSVGTWKSSGSSIEEWNTLYYNSWDYSKSSTGEQFTQCCDAESTFYINSATPQSGKENIKRIYFKKISSEINHAR